MAKGISRRHFFYGTLLAGAVPAGGFGSVASLKQLGYKSPNEKLNIAAIGAGGKGYTDINGCALTENIVAMADPDDKRAERTFKQYPKAPKYKDFRRMFDKELQQHRRGDRLLPGPHARHRRDVGDGARQTRLLPEAADAHGVGGRSSWPKAAAKYKVATQMGNQGYSNDGARECCEIIWSGRHRQRDRGARLDQPPAEVLAAGAGRGAEGSARAGRRSIGMPGWAAPNRGPSAPLTRRTTGAASRISAAAPSATWPATSWARPTWRCGSPRLPASSA